MRVLLTIDSLDPEAGGTTEAVLQLADALAAAGADGSVEVHLAAHGLDPARSRPADDASAAPAVYEVPATLLPRSRGVWERHVMAVGPDLVHDHGIWLRSNRAVAVASRRLGIARVVSTHGMLAPWALRHRAWRKRAAWALFQRRDLGTAAAVHATSQAEAADVAAAGVSSRVVVIPHGVHVPARGADRGRSPRRALFIGRLHPVKGLAALIDAWAEVGPPGWELVVAGPDVDGHRAALERRRDAAGIGDTIRFVGRVDTPTRDRLLREADLFVLPSLTENFGVAVAEALAAGVPAIVSRRAPWGALLDERAGWWIEPEAAALAGALREAMSLGDEQRAAMGERGRGLVERDFAWPAVAERMLDLYRDVLGAANAGSR